MAKIIAISALAAALIASGAYSPQAHVTSSNTYNITVVKKNQPWPSPSRTIDLCDLSLCQDV
ncbi:MAG TPA: hypothetical protein VH933_05080 [Aestuariivirgaceae bacterium]|jgi:hypothetical protein